MKHIKLLSVIFAATLFICSCGSKGAKPEAVAKDYMSKRYSGDFDGAAKCCNAAGAQALELDRAMWAGVPDSMKAKMKSEVWENVGEASITGSNATVSMKAKNSGDQTTVSLAKEGDKWLVSGLQ